MKKSILLPLLLTLGAFADTPSFTLLNKGLYYPLSRELQFPFSSAQVTNLEIVVSKCYVNNLNAYRLDSDDMKSRMATVVKKRIELTPPFAEKANRLLKLSDLRELGQPGVYHLQVNTGVRVKRYSWSSWWTELEDDCLFALTDLGLAATVAPSKDGPKAVVLVHSLANGAPCAGVKVTVLTKANQIAGEGSTDPQGVAEIPFKPSYRPQEDDIYGVLATAGDDVAYLQLDWQSAVRTRDDAGQLELEDARAFLFAERDICRPGESFDTGLFLRQSPQGGMKALGNAPVELELRDPEGNSVDQRRIRTDRWGFAAATWAVPAAARTGSWTVRARLAGRQLGTFSVTVSAYVPDRFRVELKGDRAAGGLSFRGAAAYYFGESVREGGWKLSAAARLAPPAAHWADWTVGTDEIPEGLGWAEKGQVSDGSFGARYPQELLTRLRQSKSPVLLDVEASVTPIGARTVTARETLRLDAAERYVGVREAAAHVRGRRAFEFAFLPAEKGACVATNGTIDVKLVRREWKCHAVERNGGYRMEWREERTELPQLARRTGAGVVSYGDEELASGSYTLVATCGALETRLDFWQWAGEVSARSASPAELQLKADRDRVKPGESVGLSFVSSVAGLAYVAVGERGIEQTRVLTVRPGENRFSIAVRPDAAGSHTYAAVTLIGRDSPNARRLSGLARIRVDHAATRYPVELTLPDVARPGETVGVTVRSDGAGAVRLMAVDEGVLALTGYAAPDAFRHFHDNDFGCPFGLYDVYSQVYPDLKILPNGQIGGGALGAAMKRKNVRTRRDSTLKQKETARVVLPLVEIPASGVVTVPMTLPAFTGAMRLMAVAVDESRSGGAAKTVVVRDAASLFVNAPRAVTGGDRYELVAELFNHDLPDSDWTLVVAGRAFSGRLAKGASTNIAFAVSVPETACGVTPVKGVLKIGGETYRDEVPVTVRPKRPPTTEVVCRLLPPGAPQPAAEPTDAWLRLDEDVAETCGSPKDVVAGALKWLGDYPYGCLEQVTAAAFPFLSAGALRQIGLADAASASNAAVKVKAAYGEILQMAQDDGSFAMWPGGDETWTDGSLFALHFIFAAERQGLVRPAPRDRMIRWLRRLADGNNPKTRVNRAYAAYVLALAGEEKFALAARNILSTPTCDFASFLAAAALMRGGYRADGEVAFRQALVARVWDAAALPPSVCWSRVRARAMALAIVTETLPTDASAELVAPLVGQLMESLRHDGSAWGSTRDNAWAAAGLAAFCAAHPGGRFFRRVRTGILKTPPARAAVIRASRALPARVKKGDLVTVKVTLRAPKNVASAVLCDLLPGGFELEDASLKTRSGSRDDGNSGRSEVRDDRWLWFGSLSACGKDDAPLTLTYRLRATVRGTFAVPALSVEDMYDPDFAGFVDAAGTVTVE